MSDFKLQAGQTRITKQEITLASGARAIIEVISGGPKCEIISQYIISKGEVEPKDYRICLYCDGVLYSCISCTMNCSNSSCVDPKYHNCC